MEQLMYVRIELVNVVDDEYKADIQHFSVIVFFLVNSLYP